MVVFFVFCNICLYFWREQRLNHRTMKNMLPLIIIILLALSSQSCTTTKHLNVNNEFYSYYKNKSENQIIDTLGEPDKKQRTSTGEKIFIYESDRSIYKAFNNQLRINNYVIQRGKNGYMEFRFSDSNRVTYAETNVLRKGKVFSPGKTIGLVTPLILTGIIVLAASNN